MLAQTSAGNWQYVHPDHLGSVRQVSDAAGMVLLGQNYDPFGNPVATYGAGTSAFGYTGEQADESGLLFLRARYYDAETGRFLSQDPFEGTLEQPYSQHPYQYGYSNPVQYIDPSGRNGCLAGLVMAGIDGPIPIGDAAGIISCLGQLAADATVKVGPYALGGLQLDMN